jgi:predicted XRE-type DNA-binding protein
MRDIPQQTWEIMAEFSNTITELIDQVELTPPEIITVLEMISARLKQLLEAKKAER